MTAIEKAQGKAPKYEKDIRKVVENKYIDIVSIATPNHWHALMAVWAMQNGKDVYVEKPVTHNVREGAIMTAAARKYNRICQVGTQSRSQPRHARGHRVRPQRQARQGRSGERPLLQATGRASATPAARTARRSPPRRWTTTSGAARRRYEMPHRNNKGNGTVHYDWHWIWNTGNGDLGNQGIHEMDKARWGLGKTTMPNSVFSVGGRFGYVDDGETANTQLCVFDYGAEKMIFEVRGLPTKRLQGRGRRQHLGRHRGLRRLPELRRRHRLRQGRQGNYALRLG